MNSSGRRDSNPRPSAWKADALPTELLPLVFRGQGRIRTSVGLSPADLQSAPFNRFGTYPFQITNFPKLKNIGIQNYKNFFFHNYFFQIFLLHSRKCFTFAYNGCYYLLSDIKKSTYIPKMDILARVST